MPRPARPWFRMYAEALDSRKLQKMKPPLFKHWFNLMCLASMSKERGTLPSVSDIAFRLRLSDEQIAGVLEELTALRLIDADGDTFVMHDWDEWQYESDARLTDGRKPTKRGGSAALPPQNYNVSSRKRRTDTDTEKETEKETEPEAEQSATAQGVVPVVRAFERCFGRPLSPMEIENIRALEEEHTRDRIDYALREAAELNKRSVRYVQRICENQASNGDSHERPEATATTNPRGMAAVGLSSSESAFLERIGWGKREWVDG